MPQVSLFQNRVLEKLGHKPSQGRYSMLEPDEGKPSRPVLRRGDGSNSVSLAGASCIRPDLLCHQQYPTWYGSKVTRCQMPTNRVSTVIRLTPEPRGNGVSASIRRRWGWMDGMVNTGELSINVVKSDKPKMLTGLSQK